MKRNFFKYLFIILSLLFVFNITYTSNLNTIYAKSAADVFGNGSTSTTASGSNVENRGIDAGQTAKTQVAKFKNIDALNSALDKFFELVRWGIAFLTGFGTITSFFILSLAFVRLSAAPSSSWQRRNCYMDILKGAISTICFGGLTLIMTVFYKTFSSIITRGINISSRWKDSFAYALVEYQYLICGVCGILSLSMFVLFVKDIMELAASGGNPQGRASAMKKILVTGVATIGIGGVGVLVAIFNGLLA